MALNPLILYRINDPETVQRLNTLCRSLHFRTKPVTAADAGRTVGALCGRRDVPQTAGKVPAGYSLPELLIFSELSEAALDLFLAAWRREGIPPVALKAIVTPHNAKWPLYALTDELQQERAAMLLMRQNPPKES